MIDWKIIVNGIEYYARGSDTTDLFYSPLFEKFADYEAWVKGGVEFEYEPLVLNDEDIMTTKEVLNKLQDGQLPLTNEVDTLVKLVKFNMMLSEFADHNNQEEIDYAQELGILDEYQEKYGGNIYDLYFEFVENYKYDDMEFSKEYLKLLGRFLLGLFNNTELLDKPFQEVYEGSVNIQETD